MSNSKFSNFLSKNSGTLLGAASILSYGFAMWRMYVSSPRIHDICRNAKDNWDEAETVEQRKRTFKRAALDIFVEGWPILLGFSTGVATEIIDIRKLSSDVNKYAFLWSASNQFVDKYRTAVKEEVGEKREKDIHDKAVQKYSNEPQFIVTSTVTGGDGDWIIYDSISKQTIVSNETRVMTAMNKVYDICRRELTADYASFLYEIGGDPTKIPDDLAMSVWDIDQGILEPIWMPGFQEGTNRPIGILSYNILPKPPKKSLHE